MAKTKNVFVCSSCGYESAKWLGRCPGCNEWNSFYEEKFTKTAKLNENKKIIKATKLNEVEKKTNTRFSTGIKELDRVLGGGMVEGSLILLGGEPGIGKSTLILQICNSINLDGSVLYISGEESAEQVK